MDHHLVIGSNDLILRGEDFNSYKTSYFKQKSYEKSIREIGVLFFLFEWLIKFPTARENDHSLGKTKYKLHESWMKDTIPDFIVPYSHLGKMVTPPDSYHQQDYGNGEEFISSSVHDKSHIFHPEREHQELLFDITSWRDGKYCTKEERKLKYQIIKRAANRRDKMMRTLFLNVKTKEKMEDCANSWGHCAEVVPLREENS
ncbi:hypothetical protein RIR_jg18041.t1 [Rhizophagus irregularis DAOM 181602=DAOM 197198]|nr:hypothetical protein RIR_jg18041.t1 [Rhizophagus irregularis DAOM 181602=DAOM 197198]